MAMALERVLRRRWWHHVESCRAFVAESECWPQERLREYQLERLQSVVRHAYEHVPYYRRRFDEAGVRPEHVRSLDDIVLLPTLTKEQLQAHQDELLATNVGERDRKYYTTGGSTAVPVGFYQDRGRTSAYEWAFMTSQWRRVGYRDGDRTVVFRGSVTGKDIADFDPLRNSLILSSYHLTDDRIPEYLVRVRRARPRYIQAYPSSITILARYMRIHGEPPLDGVRAVLCGSENLYDWQRAEIEEAVGARTFSWYGQSEVVCLAGECETRHELHIFPQYGVTELLDEAGSVIDEPWKLGEIVGTGFLTRVMPLIRYRPADMASYADGTCPDCGRPYRRFERIEGRLQEFIVSKNGRYISMTAINMHSPVFDNVHQFRFYQDTAGEVTFRYVPRASYSAGDDARIHAELRRKLGDDMVLSLERVDRIESSGRGKHRFLEQKLSTRFGDPE
jgi:phenylacetate-CoA ligase